MDANSTPGRSRAEVLPWPGGPEFTCRQQTRCGCAGRRRRRACRRLSTTIAWAWPKPLSKGGATGDVVAPLGQCGAPLRRAPGPRSSTCGPCAAVQVSKPVTGPCSTHRPASMAAARATGRGGTGGSRAAAGSAAGRRRPSCRTRPASDPSGCVASAGVRRVRRAAAGSQLGRVAGLEREAEAAVVEVDAGVRLDEPRAEARRVRLDQRHAHPLLVDGAQVRGVAVGVRSREQCGTHARIDLVDAAPRWPAAARRRRRVVAARRDGRGRRPWPPRSAGAPTARRRGRRAGPDRSASTAAPSSEVALRVRWDRVQSSAERLSSTAASTQSAWDAARSSAVN